MNNIRKESKKKPLLKPKEENVRPKKLPRKVGGWRTPKYKDPWEDDDGIGYR